MTIVNCNFFDAPEDGATLTVERWGAYSDGNTTNPYRITKTLIDGQTSVSLVPSVYMFTGVSRNRVFYSQKVSVPNSATPVDLWDIASDTTVPPSQIDQSIGAIATRLSTIPTFVADVAAQVPVSGAQEKRVDFTNADLNTAGNLIVIHNFGKAPRSVRLKDSDGWEIEPDDTQDNGLTTTVISLGSMRPIVGTWQAILGA